MKSTLKLIVLVIVITVTAQSCVGPTYVQSSPPPPVYTQAPPPPPQQPVYNDQPQNQTYNQNQENPAPPAVTYQSFYTELSPYGQWVYTPEYGNVWVPSAGADFQPYGSSGHWVLTEFGWTWVSDYNWGWAPFHYGRWEFDGLMGWYWIPGYEWAPAWVSWRSSPGYYGWCPLGPNYVEGGYATYNCPPERYVFVSATYINSPNVYSYCRPRNESSTYYSNSTVVSNTYSDANSHATYFGGPRREEVERATGTQIQPARVVSASSPERGGVNGSQVSIFRPAVVRPNENDQVKPAPPKVYQKNEIAPISQRTVLTRPNQPRVEPFKPENIQQQQKPPVQEQQHPAQQPQQQQQQQKPPVQEQQHPAQQPQQQQQQQKPPVQEQQRPTQQPQQQQQHPAQQPQQQQRQQQPQQQRQQQPKAPKPQKQPKPQKPQNQAPQKQETNKQ
jgi:hypothetical protein